MGINFRPAKEGVGGIGRKKLKVGSVEWDGEELPMICILQVPLSVVIISHGQQLLSRKKQNS